MSSGNGLPSQAPSGLWRYGGARTRSQRLSRGSAKATISRSGGLSDRRAGVLVCCARDEDRAARRTTSSRRRGQRTTTGNGSARNSTTRPRGFLRPSTCGSALRVCMSRRAGGWRTATRPARHSSRTPWISRTRDRVPARIHRATARCLFDLGGVVGAQGFAAPALFRRGRLILFRQILELPREIDGRGGGRRP